MEKYTLGEKGRSKALTGIKSRWTASARRARHIILFGVNSPQEYQQALALGADGVMVNSPAEAKLPQGEINHRPPGIRRTHKPTLPPGFKHPLVSRNHLDGAIFIAYAKPCPK